jgi:hypothetical protein
MAGAAVVWVAALGLPVVVGKSGPGNPWVTGLGSDRMPRRGGEAD